MRHTIDDLIRYWRSKVKVIARRWGAKAFTSTLVFILGFLNSTS